LDNSTTEFDKIENAATEKRRLQDFDDLQNELSGNDVGRIQRFLSPEASALLTDKRNGKQSAAMTALDLMLLDNPHYAEIYHNAMDKMADYENATERALVKLEAKLSDAEADIENTLDHTATLPDGRKVFRDADGQVWDEHQNLIDEATAASIEWQGSEPSYEAYLEQRHRAQELRNSIHDVRVYQTDVLGVLRDKMTNPDHPMSADEIKAGIADAGKRMPEAVQAEMPKDTASPSASSERSNDISIPNL
jgi:hypothetical protein